MEEHNGSCILNMCSTNTDTDGMQNKADCRTAPAKSGLLIMGWSRQYVLAPGKTAALEINPAVPSTDGVAPR